MKKTMKKRLFAVLSFVLVCAMTMGIATFASFADSTEESDKLVDIFYDKVVNEYYDDVYTLGYDYLVKLGLIEDAIAEIDKMIAQLKEAEAQIPDEVPEEIPEEWPEEIPEDWLEQIPEDLLDKIPEDVLQDLLDKYGKGDTATFSARSSGSTTSEYVEYVAYVIKLREEISLALDTLNELKAILEGDDLTTYEGLVEKVDYLKVTLRDRLSRIELLWILLAEDDDPNNDIDPEVILKAIDTLESAESDLENEVIPAVEAALEVIAAEAYDPMCDLLGRFLEKQIGSADEIADALETIEGMTEDEIKARVEEIIEEFTHADYEINTESYYVAVGNLYDRTTYADILADDLEVDYEDLIKKDLTIEKFIEDFASYEAALAKADLITIGFSEATSLVEVIEKVLSDNADYGVKWENLFDEKGAEVEAEIEVVLEDLYKELTNRGIKEVDTIEAVVAAVEYYCYKCAAHAVSIHEAVSKIETLNPDAVVVVVGQYDPLSGVSYDNNGEIVDVGMYLDYMFDAFGVYDLLYAILYENCIYVDAPEVEVVFNETVLDVNSFTQVKANTVIPTAAGHQYIKEQIWNALNITKNLPCEHEYGDWVEKDPADCTEKGLEVKTCKKCGDTLTRDIDPLGHDWKWVEDEPATVLKPGVKHEECSRCHEKRNENTPIPQLDHEHKYGDWTETKPAKCGEKGEATRICSICNHEDKKEIPALEHDWQWVIDKEATADEAGSKHEECTLCHEKRNENTEIPKTSDAPDVTIFVVVALLAVAAAASVGVYTYNRKRFN